MQDQTQAMAARLVHELRALRQRAVELEDRFSNELLGIDPTYLDSARNLLHYLSLRQVDARQIQSELTMLGLSSLGGAEAYTMSALNAVIRALDSLAGQTPGDEREPAAPVDFFTGRMYLEDHTTQLLGRAAGKRSVRIMVTMPSEAAHDSQLIQDLLTAGMDVMRINCAHDDADAWRAKIRNLRQAERATGRPCKVYVDLAGPKLRTGPIAPSGRILRFRPRRDVRGIVVEPAKLWFTPARNPAAPPKEGLTVIPMDAEVITAAQPGDLIELRDLRGRRRRLHVVETADNSLIAESRRTGYVETGLTVALVRDGNEIITGVIGDLPEIVEPIRLYSGDHLVLTRGGTPGTPTQRNEEGQVIAPARIPCTLPEAFDSVRAGERVWLDDGKIGGRIIACDTETITVEINHARPSGEALRAEKGINLPDTDLPIRALTDKDSRDLVFAAQYADMVGLSFVREVEDIAMVEERLEELGARQVGIVLKIETRRAFENLPRLLLASMRTPPDGVMVARGDLATEVGFGRLAEVQEEILWLCEAAHIPVIWATQVLESLAKRGAPSRAEVSDVVMSGRAECVMLNKGPYIVEAVSFLSGVLERMQPHVSKRRAMLDQLSVSHL